MLLKSVAAVSEPENDGAGVVVPLAPVRARSHFQQYAASGFAADLVPVIPPGAALSPESKVRAEDKGKSPGLRRWNGWTGFPGWRDYVADQTDIGRWSRWDDANMGLQGRNWPGCDIDVTDGPLAEVLETAAQARLGLAPVRFGRAPKRVLVYALAQGAAPIKKRKLRFQLEGEIHAVEILGAGQHYVVEGIHPVTQRPYSWRNGESPATLGAGALTPVTAEDVDAFMDDVAFLLDLWGAEVLTASGSLAANGEAPPDQDSLLAPIEDVRAAVAAIPNDERVDYESWVRLGRALAGATANSDDGWDLWLEWSQSGIWDNSEADCRAKWDSFAPPHFMGARQLFEMARPYGFNDAALAFETLPEPTGTPQRRKVLFHPDRLVDATEEVEEAMLADTKHEPVLAYAGAYVTIRPSKSMTVQQVSGHERMSPPVVFRYDHAALKKRALQSCRIVVRTRKGEEDRAGMPDDIVKMLISQRGGKARPLTGIVTTPTIRPDGTLLSAEGYDPATGVYCAFGGDVGSLPEHPSHGDAVTALALLRKEAFAEFPFASDTDRDAAVAALLTGVARPMLPGAPGFAASSPVQGSGKTVLLQLASQLAFGRPAGAASAPLKEEEMAKTIVAVLREGKPAVLFDNLPDGRVFDSAQLAQALTSPTYSARVLGVNETLELPTNTLWMLTGNNLRVAGDLASRILTIYLDAKSERPDQREYSRDLWSWAEANRPAVIRAALAIMRAYVTAGLPKVNAKPSRFPDWDVRVRNALIWAGGSDVGTKFDEAYQDDPGRNALRDALEAWQALFGGDWVFCTEVIEKLEMTDGLSEDATHLREALEDLGCCARGRLTAAGLGKGLKRHANRVVGALRLECRFDTAKKSSQWSVRRSEVTGETGENGG